MPKGKDEYQALPGAEHLTWTDSLRAQLHSDMLKTDERTGATVNPKKEFLKERIKVRQAEAAAEQKSAAKGMKKELGKYDEPDSDD